MSTDHEKTLSAVRAELTRRHGTLVEAAWKHAHECGARPDGVLIELGMVALWQAKIDIAPADEVARVAKGLGVDLVDSAQ